jgi:hypothetical protein
MKVVWMTDGCGFINRAAAHHKLPMLSPCTLPSMYILFLRSCTSPVQPFYLEPVELFLQKVVCMPEGCSFINRAAALIIRQTKRPLTRRTYDHQESMGQSGGRRRDENIYRGRAWGLECICSTCNFEVPPSVSPPFPTFSHARTAHLHFLHTVKVPASAEGCKMHPCHSCTQLLVMVVRPQRGVRSFHGR